MNITISLIGLDKVQQYLQEMPRQMLGALGRAISKSAFTIEGEGKRRTPVDTGRLRSSIFTSLKDRGLTATIMPTTNYAIYVHENLKARHTTGEAKFMERAVSAKENEIQSIFNEEIDNALK